MPNWCVSNYRFVGDKKDIHNFYNIIRKGISSNYAENGFGENWIGNLVVSVGKDIHKIACRGTIDSMSIVDDNFVLYDEVLSEFTLETTTAWGTMPQIFVDIIQDNDFDIRFSLEAVEPCMEVFLVYDELNEHTPRYFADFYTFGKLDEMDEAFGEMDNLVLMADDLEEYLDDMIDTSDCATLDDKINKALKEVNVPDLNVLTIAPMEYVDDISTLY